MQHCLRQLWFSSVLLDFEVSTKHTPGRHNQLAGYISRRYSPLPTVFSLCAVVWVHYVSRCWACLFFILHDCQNYAHWLPAYLSDTRQLQQEHPTVHQKFMQGEHAISLSSQPFSSIWIAIALEQSINFNSKSKCGIVGTSLNPNTLQRWFLTWHHSSQTYAWYCWARSSWQSQGSST